MVKPSLDIEQFCLLRAGRFGGGGFDGGPARDQFVIGTSIFSPASAFAKGVEPI